eukprot:CAMPEP_0173442946 /NCGR_PEP_ID=MMETSP1357-20121228/28592_1 /TAXON_ID=77926 /ORGANISM="Hemiselmis rufescens, Strain PCC563" /LENGTH=190 /DNA_ID=CAMNT_0014408785 /DNA_START=1 /DNA_END=573 /DNA_ORIENTATION=+
MKGVEGLRRQLEVVHWNEEAKAYQDRGEAQDSKKKGADRAEFADHLGYVGLTPLMMGLISDPDRVNWAIKPLWNSRQLQSDAGVKSMSHVNHARQHDWEFAQADNLWRGKVYVPFNYMLLSGLSKWYIGKPEITHAKQVYDEVRASVLENVVEVYLQSGFFWEAYNVGVGEGSLHKAWSALVLLIMAEKF